MRSRPTSSMLRITFFSILTSWDSFLARSGPKAPAVFLRKAWPGRVRVSRKSALLNLQLRFRGGNRTTPIGTVGRPWVPRTTRATELPLPVTALRRGRSRHGSFHDGSWATSSIQSGKGAYLGCSCQRNDSPWWRSSEAGGFESARRWGPATVAWNRCDAW
jgi:hypothetical protein